MARKSLPVARAKCVKEASLRDISRSKGGKKQKIQRKKKKTSWKHLRN